MSKRRHFPNSSLRARIASGHQPDPGFVFVLSRFWVYLDPPDCQGSTLVTEPATTPALQLKGNIRVENNLHCVSPCPHPIPVPRVNNSSEGITCHSSYHYQFGYQNDQRGNLIYKEWSCLICLEAFWKAY